MRIAIIGTGIAGMTAAYLLSKKHDVVVYEKEQRLGGHTATKTVEHNGNELAIDTGFIVFNDWTYPNFKKILADLHVDYQPSSMGFSVSCDQTGLEYSGESLNTLFAQRKNIFSCSHWTMLRDIMRFNKQALTHIEAGGKYLSMTLGEYLIQHKYSSVFMDKYLMPMGAAIWSSSTSAMRQFPLQFFVRFFKNHGLLSVHDRPQWHVIKGGSKQYIEPLTKSYKNSIRLNSGIASIQRQDQTVTLRTLTGEVDTFDQVVIATHSDQALALLADPSTAETSVLGDIAYKSNDVVLHTDERMLPNNRRTWSSWNYRILDTLDAGDRPPVLTYNMNILQSLSAQETFCVTLNHTDAIDEKKIIGSYQYSHPVFTEKAIAAQARWQEINGVNNTWFCGAYWFNGFHEDGVKSAVRIANTFGIEL